MQLCTPKDEVPAAEGPSGEGPAPKDRSSCHDYCLEGFKCLVDLARCHSQGGAPVRWGWSRCACYRTSHLVICYLLVLIGRMLMLCSSLSIRAPSMARESM